MSLRFALPPILMVMAGSNFAAVIAFGEAASWTLGQDGSYSNAESTVVCPKSVGTFSIVRVTGETGQNPIGVCEYADGYGRNAEIRVRRYILQAGETPRTTGEIGRSLMDPSTSQDYIFYDEHGAITSEGDQQGGAKSQLGKCYTVVVSKGRRVVTEFDVCNGPETTVGGAPMQRAMLTVPIHGRFVVDCVAWESKSAAAPNDEVLQFRGKTCGNMLGRDVKAISN